MTTPSRVTAYSFKWNVKRALILFGRSIPAGVRKFGWFPEISNFYQLNSNPGGPSVPRSINDGLIAGDEKKNKTGRNEVYCQLLPLADFYKKMINYKILKKKPLLIKQLITQPFIHKQISNLGSIYETDIRYFILKCREDHIKIPPGGRVDSR